jgi:hypothetical protein
LALQTGRQVAQFLLDHRGFGQPGGDLGAHGVTILLAQAVDRGQALNMASHLEIDEVIDPEQTRRWVMAGLRAAPPVLVREGRKRPCVDTW